MIDVEQLKVIATVLGLVISTATVQLTIAKFVNDVRDSIVKEPPKGIHKASLMHDLLWGYVIGIAFNALFLMVASIVKTQTRGTELGWLGKAVFIIFLLNLILWVTGSFLDSWRALSAKPK